MQAGAAAGFGHVWVNVGRDGAMFNNRTGPVLEVLQAWGRVLHMACTLADH